MFQLADIQTAHAKVKSGADFPAYIQDLIQLGVVAYDTFVSDGRAVYFGNDGYSMQSESKYPELTIAEKAEGETFASNLKIHQQGQTDYLTFCRHSAEAGVEKWTVDLKKMTCSYYDTAGNVLLEEKIPTA